MGYLIAASLLWAFSFGLIKGQLTGLDPVAVACVRLVLAALVFAPMVHRRRIAKALVLPTMGLGALQFGLMYVLYIQSYSWLPAWMVALFTVFTPLYVILLADALARRFSWRNLAAALLAVVGALAVVAQGMPVGADWRGIVVLQGANLCFAVGQVLFGRLKARAQGQEAGLVAWMYIGAALVTALAVMGRDVPGPEAWDRQVLWVLLYLGVLPTAVGFYLWNKGAGQTRPGLLAGANNLKVPLAVLVSWLVFGEEADYLRVGLGLVLVVGALFLVGRKRSTAP